MRALKSYLSGTVEFINVLNEQIMRSYPQINIAKSRRILHVLDSNNRLRLGVDANVYLWEIAGKKPYLSALRWPVINPVANFVYWAFAKNRYRLSLVLTGKSKCEQCEP
ncbi:DCC1-like thiol-disulfide oxidoreductase family protein [Vibrio kasasachensis]